MSDTPLAFFRRHPDYARYFIGMVPIQIAVQIESITVAWQVYHIARETRSIEESAFMVGMVGLCQFLPLFVLTLYAGTLADRISRKAIVIWSLVAEALGVAGLMAIALQETPSLMPIFVISGLFGAARAFLSPAASAMVPMLVSRTDMPRAISLSTTVWMVAILGGPFLGGLLIDQSIAAAYGIATVFFVFGIASLALVRARTTPERQGGNPLTQLREGLSYVWGNKVVFGAISLDLFAVLLGGATALLPAFATDILQVGSMGNALLRMGPALGGLAMSTWLAFHPIKNKAGVKMFLGVAAFGLATIVFGLSTNLWLSVAALAVLGAGDMISVNVRQTLIQIVTPDHMRGRVSAVSGLFISGSNELGEFETGVVSRFIGPVMAAVTGGIGTLMVTGIWAWAFPALRRADRLDHD
ncbi:MFS transporter [Stagnihabitans tardus]|uniref:MFS transporter n=1 Tax=Stagnihabitans tardus TaxID=2699202 RepID=A0AAE4YAT0_9RHOB|nr:MFS transporter [Stagnihabitans tardus]NBZ88001.1 MFS transporter [Stagnihabitans tardus]